MENVKKSLGWSSSNSAFDIRLVNLYSPERLVRHISSFKTNDFDMGVLYDADERISVHYPLPIQCR